MCNAVLIVIALISSISSTRPAYMAYSKYPVPIYSNHTVDNLYSKPVGFNIN